MLLFSDCWRSCKLCGLHLCSRCTRYSSRCTKYNYQVSMSSHCSVMCLSLVWYSLTNLSFFTRLLVLFWHIFYWRKNLRKWGFSDVCLASLGLLLLSYTLLRSRLLIPLKKYGIWLLSQVPLSFLLGTHFMPYVHLFIWQAQFSFSYPWNSFSNLRSHNHVDCPCFNSALWTPVRPNKHSGLYRNLFVNGCSHCKLVHLSILDP